MSRGEEIFAKDCLAMKALKKMDKSELLSTIEINLANLVDYYYGQIHHKDERDYRDSLIDLVLNKKLFLKPVAKIYKQEKSNVPSGLAFMLYDCLEQAKHKIYEGIEKEKESDKSKEEKEKAIESFNELLQDIQSNVAELMVELTEKSVKKLKKLGVKKSYGLMLAPMLLDAEYVTSKNLFRFVRIFVHGVYDVVAMATIKDQDGNYVNDLGISLSNSKDMKKFMSIIIKDMDAGTLGEFIKQILLEKRDRNFDNMTQSQLAVYSSITNWALNMLEDKELFGNKSRIEIIRSYGIQVLRDQKRGRDSKRRINFSELDPDMYPRIMKAFKTIEEKGNKNNN